MPPSESAHTLQEEKQHFDFTSEHFKPLDALANPQKALPNLPEPKARTFNNISEYANKTFKKSTSIQASSSSSSSSKSSNLLQPEIQRKFTQEQINSLVPTKKHKQLDNVLTLMDKADGPLLLLKRSLGQIVRILVMKFKSASASKLRVSWMTARLIAFDKHFNLILHDVIENSMDGLESKIDQLFLRGDSVILISDKV